MKKSTFKIPGIHCAGCANLIRDVSSEFPAIKNVAVDIESKQVELEHEESLDMKKWAEEIEALGEQYKVTLT